MAYIEFEVPAAAVESEISATAITELSEAQLVLVGGGQGDIHLG